MGWKFIKLAIRVPTLKTMFPVKREPCDTFDVGKDSQRIRLEDGNPHISDTSDINTSDNRPDKCLHKNMFLTVAYVKNESTLNALDYNTSNSKENKDIHGPQLKATNLIKREMEEACTDNTSEAINDEDIFKIHVKEESEHCRMKEDIIHHVTDISQHDRVGMSDTINMGELCPSSATQLRYNTHKHIPKKVHVTKKRFKCDKCDYTWLSGDVPRLPSYGIYIPQLVRFARCCTSVLDFHSKNLQITSKLLTQGYRYHKLRKTFGKFFRSYSQLLSKFCDISFQEYVSKGIFHPVFYGDLVFKLRRVKGTPNFISSGSKIVKRLRRRQYDPLIIERTIGLVLGPSTTLYGPFLKHCTLTNKAVGTI